MRTIKFTIFIVLLIVVGAANAQIKIKSNGKLIIGPDRPNDDVLNLLSAQISGPHGSMNYGGKLAIGDFGSTSGWNVLIGEYGNSDSDLFWLHGKKGLYITRGSAGSTVLAYYNEANGNRFTFNCDVYSLGVKLTSDERLKTNIKGIDNSLAKLRKLDGVSYNYNLKKEAKDTFAIETSSKTEELSEKDRKYLEEAEKWEKENNPNNATRIGFIAQSMQKVFPELVDEDKEGYLSIDYIGLIPVIVEALKEQQEIIDAQSQKIKELENKVTSLEKVDNKNIKSATDDSEIINAFLYQNVPNPFSYDTEIKYFIPENLNNAAIYIFNLHGNLLKTENIYQSGEGSLIIKASDFKPGMYIYSLVVNGKEVDTKRMILTE